MEPCDFRSEAPGSMGEFYCAHPKVYSPGAFVSSQVCELCTRRVSDLGPSIRKKQSTSFTSKPSVSTWAVGVTTAPRRKETLSRCLKSLLLAGWNDFRLFAEPGSPIPSAFLTSPITQRDRLLGAFPNWYLGLAELHLREPRAAAYFLLQDDAILAEGLRAYLENTLWRATCVGVVSAYCPSHYSMGINRGYRLEDRGKATWGAVAYIFPNRAARCLLGDAVLINHRHHGPADGMRNIDNLVGGWCLRSRLPYYVHEPSLAQHIGDTSTIWVGGEETSAIGKRAASDFIENVEALSGTRGSGIPNSFKIQSD
jgi:hypothetical protein